MQPFEFAEPKTLREAIALLDTDMARPFSGGTALMLMMKAGVLHPERLVSLAKLGLKNPKHIAAIHVTNTDPGGYWEDQGYNWFSGS